MNGSCPRPCQDSKPPTKWLVRWGIKAQNRGPYTLVLRALGFHQNALGPSRQVFPLPSLEPVRPSCLFLFLLSPTDFSVRQVFLLWTCQKSLCAETAARRKEHWVCSREELRFSPNTVADSPHVPDWSHFPSLVLCELRALILMVSRVLSRYMCYKVSEPRK
jgi:hypothetical protein